MASMSDIKITLDDDVLEIFRATRLSVCTAQKCIHNTIRHDIRANRAECMLKNIHIDDDGKCGMFALDGKVKDD